MTKRSRRSEDSHCRICGEVTHLSFEHVPPRAAYNNLRVLEYAVEDIIYRGDKKTAIRQKGIGYNTLCNRCNNDTGAWYGAEYVSWARVCMELVGRWQSTGRRSDTVILREVYPLRFLKQLVTCFFSVVGYYGGTRFAKQHPALVDFVRNRDEQGLPEEFFFSVNLYAPPKGKSPGLRQYPIAAKLPVVYDKKGGISAGLGSIFQEIAHPPFQLFMVQDRPYHDATNITHFKQYGYEEMVDIQLVFRLKESSSYLPGN